MSVAYAKRHPEPKQALAALFLVVTVAALGDGGSIPFRPKVKVFEPNQRALISWNGTEEILILSTDLKSSEPTKVLEVFPFPAEPEVKEGDNKIFRKATNMINRELQRRAYAVDSFGGGGGMGGEAGGEGALPPPANVTFHEEIGSHDIAVIQALRKDGFVEWVHRYLTSQNVSAPEIPEALAEVIDEYIADGFTWFVFDVVSLSPDIKSKQALQFRFATNCLYYPLRITRTEKGNTYISLLILTSELVSMREGWGFGLPRNRVKLAHEPITISAEDVAQLSPDIADLLGPDRRARLRVWEIRGILWLFKQDLVVMQPVWKQHRGRDTSRPRPRPTEADEKTENAQENAR